jgi:hypothetical protein
MYLDQKVIYVGLINKVTDYRLRGQGQILHTAPGFFSQHVSRTAIGLLHNGYGGSFLGLNLK